MKTTSNRFPGAIGALVGIAIVVAVGAAPGASDAIESVLFAGATLGRAVAEFTALGFVLGACAFGLRQLAAARRESRRAETRLATISGLAPVPILAVPRLADATASEFDDSLQPSFAAVTSLTETQVARERAARRRAELRALSRGA